VTVTSSSETKIIIRISSAKGQSNEEYIQNHFMVTSKVIYISKRYKKPLNSEILHLFEMRIPLVYISSNKKYFLQAKRSATVIKTRQ